MHFAPSEQQREVSASLRAFLQHHADEAEVRRTMATELGYEPTTWARSCSELGLAAIGMPTKYGGTGGTVVDQILVQAELGRALYGGPFMSSTILGSAALLDSTSVGVEAILEDVAAGRAVLTLAATGPSGGFDLDSVAVQGRTGGDGWLLTGSATYVFHGNLADHLVVLARVEESVAAFLVSAHADGLSRASLRTMDETRRQSAVQFADTPGLLLAESAGEDSTGRAQHLLYLAQVALASEQVGGAERCLELTVDYTSRREQFGRPVGAYQSLQHRCAEIAQQVQAAQSAVYYAGWVAACQPDELSTAAALAKMLASEAYLFAAESFMQFQGGIGFTWDSPAHLYLKRAKSTALLHGSPSSLRRQLADSLLSGATLSASATA